MALLCFSGPKCITRLPNFPLWLTWSAICEVIHYSLSRILCGLRKTETSCVQIPAKHYFTMPWFFSLNKNSMTFPGPDIQTINFFNFLWPVQALLLHFNKSSLQTHIVSTCFGHFPHWTASHYCVSPWSTHKHVRMHTHIHTSTHPTNLQVTIKRMAECTSINLSQCFL